MRTVSAIVAIFACCAPIAYAEDQSPVGDPAGHRSSLSLRLGGGAIQSTEICGLRRPATVLNQGEPSSAEAMVRRARVRGRRRITVVVLRVRRCDSGDSGSTATRTLATRRTRRTRLRARRALPTNGVGDYRVTAEARDGGSRRLLVRVRAYLRVEEAVVDLPLRFEVRNVNRSKLSCPSDGKTYTVAGRLVAPRGVLRAPSPTATLYLHEFGWGRFFWQYPREDYDYARLQALAGHASIVVDRLGYDESSHPPGNDTCLGSQADILRQLIDQVRGGSYAAVGAEPVRFRRVAVAGHSGGGAIAELAAYSFGGVDALVLFAYADQGFTSRSIQEANEQGVTCAMGGEPSEPGGPGGYAYFAQSSEEWKSFMFTSAERPIADGAAALRNRDPCGDTASFTPAVVSNNRNVSAIDVPVLLLYGTSDAIYQQPAAGEDQRRLFSGSKDVTLRFFENTGHALTLERAAPAVRGVVSEWLGRRGF